MHPQAFWVIWITITVTALIYVRFAIGGSEPESGKPTKRPVDLNLSWRTLATPGNVASITFVSAFLVSYSAIILLQDDFAYYDNNYFTQVTLKGLDLAPTMALGGGRFFPLGHLEFNLVRHLTDTAIGYHALPVAELLIFFCLLLILDAELSFTARGVLAILTLVTPSIFMSFSGLVFPERNVLFFLACLVLSVRQFEQTKSMASAAAAVVSAQIMIYYKETASLLLLGFAAGRLILRCKNTRDGRWDYQRLWDKESRLDGCLASLALLFLFLYFVWMGIHPGMGYAAASRQPTVTILVDYLRLDLLVWAFVTMVLWRTYLIFRNRAEPLLLWDGLALGALAWFIAYLKLGMFNTYYLAPVDCIAVLYVGRFVLLSWSEMQSWNKAAALMLTFAVVIQDISFSSFVAFERKNVIQAKVEVASVVKTRYRENSGDALRLFFPFADPYVIMQFAYYLDYRGVPLNSVAWFSRAIITDPSARKWAGNCPPCHAAKLPAPGDLVVVLPEDLASASEVSFYREPGELFSYEPHPSVPQCLYRLIGRFPLAALNYWKMRPDRWMDASVTLWK